MADPTIFSWATEDDQGIPNLVEMYVAYDGATETVDSLIGGWLAYGGLIDPCIDGQITGGRVTIPLEPAGTWKANPASGNNSNQVMVLDFENDFNRFLTPLDLPSYKEALLNTSSPKAPNLANTQLAALIAAVIAGSGAIFPNSDALHDLDALRKAFLTTRRLKNNRRRTTVNA